LKKNSTSDGLHRDKNLLVKEGTKIKIKDLDPKYTALFKNKEDAAELLEQDIERLAELQDMLFASAKHSVLIVLQAMDGAGKDSTIKHVMTGVNPQGCNVVGFKQPSTEELKHDYLWRINKRLPERGMITIFNRSHYEEVLVTKVHPEYILAQNIPGINSVDKVDKDFWLERYDAINQYEKYLADNGMVIMKFFLNISKEEQKERFLKRIEEPEKNWKFSAADVKERKYWDSYMEAFEDAINHTSTKHAPWYVIPADKKWFARAAVGDVIVSTLECLDLCYPKLDKEDKDKLEEAKSLLNNE
jgi:PPK2 family polyphosphate:nucleotide phosphotransferase